MWISQIFRQWSNGIFFPIFTEVQIINLIIKLSMRKLLLSALLVATGISQAQTTVFEDSFDTYTDFAITGVGSWTMIDGDLRPTYGFTGVTFLNSGAAKAFQVFNSTTTAPPLTASASSDWTARTGDKAMVCFAAVPNLAVSQNDDWLISPAITLGTDTNTLSFWAKSCDTEFGDEQFGVYVSTTGTAVSDFVPYEEFIMSPADLTYYEYTFDLTDYATQTVYIAIRCTSADMFGFMVDDFKVTTTGLGLPNFFNQNFAAYPNPANDVLNLNSKNGLVINGVQLTDLNGRVVRNLNGGVTEMQINLSDLASGAYFLKVQSDAGVGVHKILKK